MYSLHRLVFHHAHYISAHLINIVSNILVLVYICFYQAENVEASLHLVDEYQQLLNVAPGHFLVEAPGKAGHHFHHLARHPAACICK